MSAVAIPDHTQPPVPGPTEGKLAATIAALRALYRNGDPGRKNRATVRAEVNEWLAKPGLPAISISTLYLALRELRSAADSA